MKRSAGAALVAILIGVSLVPAQDPPPFDEEAALASLRKSIEGREEEPAGDVFDNVEVLARVPAGRLLRIMETGYARSLGVSCDFCHIPGEWRSDQNRHKEIARAMAVMTRELNEKTLPKIFEGGDEKPVVNCATCHRGAKKPATSVPSGRGRVEANAECRIEN